MPDPELTLLDQALGAADRALSVLSVCDAGQVVKYATAGPSRDIAPLGAGPLLELLAHAAERAKSGVFSFRDPDRRAAGLLLVEPIEAQRVLVGVAPGDVTVAVVRMRRLAVALRLLG